MDAVFRAAVLYGFLLVIFRIAGERTLASLTTFDFVLLLIIAEVTQQGLVGDDFSVTKALLLVATLDSTSAFPCSRTDGAGCISLSKGYRW